MSLLRKHRAAQRSQPAHAAKQVSSRHSHSSLWSQNERKSKSARPTKTFLVYTSRSTIQPFTKQVLKGYWMLHEHCSFSPSFISSMHAASGLFSWTMELLEFASVASLQLKRWTLSVRFIDSHFVPFLFRLLWPPSISWDSDGFPSIIYLVVH